MKYKMIPTEKFWKEFSKGKHQDEGKTLILRETVEGKLVQDFAYVMNGFFDNHRQGLSFNQKTIKFVLVKVENKKTTTQNPNKDENHI
jgi:hypothetical protein